jgi:hypothetical protein
MGGERCHELELIGLRSLHLIASCLIMSWGVVGDITNLVGCILTDQKEFQVSIFVVILHLSFSSCQGFASRNASLFAPRRRPRRALPL